MTSASAIISSDGRYRYELWRTLDVPLLGSKGTVAFCMLNPSTADATTDDPTIRRCMGYARRWGYHKLAVVNLYPLRATSPAELAPWLRALGQVPGPLRANRIHRASVLRRADLRVAAWGDYGYRNPIAESLLAEYWWHALGLTKRGVPVHPLYQRADAEPRCLVKQATWVLA